MCLLSRIGFRIEVEKQVFISIIIILYLLINDRSGRTLGYEL